MPTSTGAIEAYCAQRPLDEVVEAMKKARVPSGPILSMQQISRDPQYRARKMFHEAPLLPSQPRKQGKEEEVPPVIVPAILPVLSRQVLVGDGLGWLGVMGNVQGA